MDKWICKCCEAENDESAAYCEVCGTKREAPASASDLLPFRKETIVYCDENGNPIDSPEKAASFRIVGTDENGNRYERFGTISGIGQHPQTASASPSFVSEKNPIRDRAAEAPAQKDPLSGAKPPVSGEEMRESIKKADQKKLLFRLLIVGFVIVQYILFLQPYSMLVKDDMIGLYAIYYNAIGENGSIEQICSIVLVVIAILPAIICWIRFKLRSRNLPITIGAFVSGLTTVYCAVIWFGSEQSTVVPAFIILCSLSALLFTVLLVRTNNRQNETVLRPKGF